jgi:ribosomal protein S6
LGNDVVTLANERAPAGEQTKTYTINKLNPGIYFLRILASGEPVVKKISVL